MLTESRTGRIRRTTTSASRPRGAPTAATLLTAALVGAFLVASPAAASATAAVAHTHPAWATATADHGAAAASTTLTPTVFYAGQDPAGMTAYAQAVSTPTSPFYRHYLTPAEYHARFGATAAQVKAVRSWLTGAGLKITSSDKAGVTVTGTTPAIQKAFGVTLRSYKIKGESYVAPTADAQVPAAVAADVGTITGLTTMPTVMRPAGPLGQVTTSLAKGVTGAKATASKGRNGATFLGPARCSSYYGEVKDDTVPPFNGKQNPYVTCGYKPSQLRGAYGVTRSKLTGKGATVAIVAAYGSPTMLADANKHAENHGDKPFRDGQYTEMVTPEQWTDLNRCGGTNGWAIEQTLDVEALHAMAPDANVRYYGANTCRDAGFLKVFQTINDTHGADIVSNSWGAAIYRTTGDVDLASIAEFNRVFAQGAIEGISYQFSTGNCGPDDPATLCGMFSESSTPQPHFPASSPWVTAVGGTSMGIGARNQALWSTAWGTHAWYLLNDAWFPGGWVFGGGGGTSSLFRQPFYQQGVVSTELAKTLPNGTKVANPMRVTPDVSMPADPFTGFIVGMTVAQSDGSTGYAETSMGGTSLACPLFAGLQASAIQAQGGENIGWANPAIYARAGSHAFTDLTATGPGSHEASVLPASADVPTVTVNFGDNHLLKAGRGYDNTSGVGTPSPYYLWSYRIR
ncbi:protease pro-enzyme activation domain-containing protein [Streptomyces sp. HUAS ZL42]|uniref:S53 family peptidase n=1 Tax=Streptomyces sp. HUAS ZL42 TaxID=3231715 RepID=UPI00345E0FC1